MALKIRLTRLGDKGNPFYRLIVAESRSPRDGKFIATLGTYDPRHAEQKVDREAALEWLAKGAQPTETARAVLIKTGVLAKEKPVKKTSIPTKKPKEGKKKKEA